MEHSIAHAQHDCKSELLDQLVDTASTSTLGLTTSQVLPDEVLDTRRFVCKPSVYRV